MNARLNRSQDGVCWTVAGWMRLRRIWKRWWGTWGRSNNCWRVSSRRLRCCRSRTRTVSTRNSDLRGTWHWRRRGSRGLANSPRHSPTKRSDGKRASRSASHLWQSSSSSRMRVIYHNWSATKQRPHPQSVAEISHHSVLSGDRILQCETSSGSRHKDTDQCL